VTVLTQHDQLEFLGIEITFISEDDPRGSVWIPFTETLSLLYGKNGAGKSTILRAVRAFLEGKSLKDDGLIINGYARLIDPTQTCSIMDQAIENMPETGFLEFWEELDTNKLMAKFQVTSNALDLPHNNWEPSLFTAVPNSIDDLEMNWDKFVSHFLFLGLWESDHVHDFPQIKPFIKHLINEKLFCLQPTGAEDKARWDLSLAANLANELVHQAYERLFEDPADVLFDEDNESLISQLLLDPSILADRSTIPRTSSSFIRASGIAGQRITAIGLSVLDLNEEFDLDDWTKRRIAEVVHSNWVTIDDSWFSKHPGVLSPTSPFTPSDLMLENSNIDDFQETLIWSASFSAHQVPVGQSITFNISGDRVDILQDTLSFIAGQLPEELAISDLRIEFVNDLGLWIFDKPATLEAFDQRSQTWIPVSETSNATQKIIGMALRIHAEIRSSHDVTIAIGDEIDQGIHSLAITGLYKMLADSIPCCYIATHSPIALSTKLGDRLHVHRGARGEILIDKIDNHDFVSANPASLGVRVNELIGMIDLVVAVEGLHDKLVLEHFLGLDRRLQSGGILVVSMTGVNNATNLVDADFILSFTDLQMLAVADNTSKSDLQSTWVNTIKRLRSGESAKKLAKSLRSRSNELKKQKWHEQRCMLDLLALGTERDLLSRIRISGHTYFDIETALNPTFFGLQKDWLELEAEYKRFKNPDNPDGKNFKDFLRNNYDVSIDQETIKTALSLTGEIPIGLQPLLNDIATNAFQSDVFLT
jgi:hypothetical protein